MCRAFYILALAGGSVAATLGAAKANPQGGSVASGSASIVQTSPSQVTVNQASNRLIINWQGFSIAPGEITNFNQPSASSVALNRVTGGDPSIILGQLSANGRLLLINPNGVLFGAGSRVDVAGLIATTADLTDQDFRAGRLNFALPSSTPTASVVNRGTITVAQGGLVALVAPGVANEGVIQARLGRVSLVSADRFTVDFHGDQLIRFALDDTVTRTMVAPDGMPLAAAVANSGRIVANGGMVQMSANVASGVLDQAIDMSGVVEARSVRQVNGAILLDGGGAGTVAVSGRLDVSGRGAGQTGGTVQILGQHVGLFGGTDINASGGAGGGTVLVGGNQHGQGPLPNAQAAYVDPQATIDADATVKGNGGTVVVWSDQYTNFGGTITARGGPQGGNGGSVETSSAGVLTVTGQVDASAPKGKPGQWLLDPLDVTISAALGTNNGTLSGGSPDTFTPGSSGASVDPGAIATALNGGSNVIINTTGGGGVEPGNITFANDGGFTINAAAPGTLTLNASGSVAVTGTPVITATGATPLTLVITAGGGVGSTITLPTISLGTGTFSLNSTGGHVSQNGPLTQAVGGGAVSINLNSHGMDLTNGGNNNNDITGTLTIAGGAGSNVSIGNAGPLTLGTVDITSAGTPLSITTSGALTQTGAITQIAGGSAVTINTGAGAITLTNAGNSITGAVSLTNSAGDAQLTNGVATTIAASTIGGNLTVKATGAITQAGAVTVGGNLTYNATGLIAQSAAATVGGNLAFSANGNITQSAALTVGGTSSFSAGANTINLDQSGNVFGGAVTVSNSGNNNVNVSTSGSLVLAASTVGSGTLDLYGGTGITQTGAVTQQANAFVGPVSLETDGAAITLTNTANAFRGDLFITFTSTAGNNPVSITNSVPTSINNSTIAGALTLTTDQLTLAPSVTTGIVTPGGTLTVQPLTTTTNLQFGGGSVGGVLDLSDAALASYHGFTGYTIGSATGTGTVTLGASEALGAANLILQAGGTGGAVTMAGNSVTLTGAGALTLSAGGTVTAAAITLATGALSVTAGTSTTLTAAIATAGSPITINGPITLAGATTLNTSLSGASGAINLAGAVTGGGNTLTLNAGSAADITLQSVGSVGAPLAGITIQNARNVTAAGLVVANTLTQVAGTGTTNFAGAGLTSTGAVTLTTGAVAGTYNVGAFTVTSGQTVATGSIAGTTGASAATLATDPGSTGTQTFNGCTIAAATCTPTTPTPPASSPSVTPTQVVTVTGSTQQIVSIFGQPAPSDNSGQSNLHGFEVTIPTQNIDWSDPAGDLRIKLAPEYEPLGHFFYAGEASNRLLYGNRSNR